MGKGQRRALAGIDAYAEKENLKYSRSRAYRKNDNCFIEQKNSTHIRQVIGYLRYDTQAETDCFK